MNLLESMMGDFQIINKNLVNDGEGGHTVEWNPGATFKAAVVMDSTMEAQIGMAQGVTSVYTITTSRDIELDFHTVVKRLNDGKIFRITSMPGDVVSPKASSLDITQVKAEKWSLTT